MTPHHSIFRQIRWSISLILFRLAVQVMPRDVTLNLHEALARLAEKLEVEP